MKILSKKCLQTKLKAFKCPFLTKVKYAKKHLQKTVTFETSLELAWFKFVLKNLAKL